MTSARPQYRDRRQLADQRDAAGVPQPMTVTDVPRVTAPVLIAAPIHAITRALTRGHHRVFDE
jgi:hypothetical protein